MTGCRQWSYQYVSYRSSAPATNSQSYSRLRWWSRIFSCSLVSCRSYRSRMLMNFLGGCTQPMSWPCSSGGTICHSCHKPRASVPFLSLSVWRGQGSSRLGRWVEAGSWRFALNSCLRSSMGEHSCSATEKTVVLVLTQLSVPLHCN